LISFLKRLNDKISDDWLIATILEVGTEFEGISLILVTNDVGLQLKAASHGLNCVELPEKCALPVAPDADEIRIHELERELVAYKKSVPNLRLAFENGKDHVRVRLFKIPLITDQEISRRMTEIRAAHPKALKPEWYSEANLMVGALGPQDYDRHNHRMDNFYSAYEKYLKTADRVADAQRRMVSLEIVLRNDGFCPAKDTDIEMHLPDGMNVSDKAETLFEVPDEPSAPVGPKTAFQERLEMTTMGGVVRPISLMADMGTIERISRNISVPKIFRTNSFDIHVHVRELKHNLQAELDTLFVLFESWHTARSFTIDYELLAANVPQRVTSRVHVIVEIEESAAL